MMVISAVKISHCFITTLISTPQCTNIGIIGIYVYNLIWYHNASNPTGTHVFIIMNIIVGQKLYGFLTHTQSKQSGLKQLAFLKQVLSKMGGGF